MLNYISTRGQAPVYNFEETMLAGLAEDGGLYVPEQCPYFKPEAWALMHDKSYVDIAFQVIHPFMQGCIEEDELHQILTETYGTFHHEEVVPLHKLEEDFWVMELFHGPTLAFKDVALQFLGRMFDYALEKRGKRLTIVGATSGDTGSAAIDACKDRDNLDIFILHPKGRVSEVQRRQMTTVQSSNVYNIAVEGSFDDCQNMVKAMFSDQKFRQEINMSAINSINWARIVAQVVYYVYASVKLQAQTPSLNMVVPTGNFGNVYAGYIAQSMGAPIDKLVVATNANDILYRFFKTGEMSQEGVTSTISPSMDIQISSNFERLLFDMFDRDSETLQATMEHFRDEGPYEISDFLMEEVSDIFDAYRLNDDETKKVIKAVWEEHGYLLDPHSAVGVGAAQQFRKENKNAAIVSLATAHPSKFPDAVKQASGQEPQLPDWLSDLYDREEKFETLPNQLQAVQSYIREKAIRLKVV